MSDGIEELGTLPDQTLFVDDRDVNDRDVNVQAAQNLGIQAIRFESVRQLRAQLEELRFPILPVLPVIPMSRKADTSLAISTGHIMCF